MQVFASTQQFLDCLREKNIPFSCAFLPEGPANRVVIELKGLNLPSTEFIVVFWGDSCSNYEGTNYVESYCEPLPINVPKNKRTKLLEILNRMNAETRYIRFVIDEDDIVRITFSYDLPKHNIGEICYEQFIYWIKICNEVYPEMMKVLYE